MKTTIKYIEQKMETMKVRLYRALEQDPYGQHDLHHFSEVPHHKSIWRAIRRGHVSVDGTPLTKRNHNNRKKK